jgi:hypothetical protein
VKILFFMHHLGSFRMYESVVRELAARGHALHIVTGRAEEFGWERALAGLLASQPNVRLTPMDFPQDGFWIDAGKTIRLWADYLRYFAPEYARTPKLMSRAEERMPPALVSLTRSFLVDGPRRRSYLLRALRMAERALPPVREIDAFIAAERPDLVLITPLVYLASVQVEVLRSAIRQGVRTAFCVGSWDHLSSKALLREMPDRVLVWNETQREEAVRLHGVPPDRVVVTGAQCYDQWFGRAPARSREAFCRRAGLPADRPFLLYVGSALFHGSPVEARFVERWVRELRSSGEAALRDTPVLLRPHPARRSEWNAVDFSAHPAVAVYGSSPVDDASKDDYFESLYYSAAVVGLNTSAFLEGAIVGRPVHTILLPEFWENQEGTLHFHYLFTVAGGVLQAGRSFAEHHAALRRSLAPDAAADVQRRRFVEAFIRPRGLGVRATDVFVEEVERLAHIREPAPLSERARDVVVRVVALAPALRLARLALGSSVMRTDWSDRARALQDKHERAMQERARKLAERERARLERQQVREAETRRKAGRRALAEEARRREERARLVRIEEKRKRKAEALARREQERTRRARAKERRYGAKRRARFRAELRGRVVRWIKALGSGGDASRV